MAITKTTKQNPWRELNSQHINHRETNFPAAKHRPQHRKQPEKVAAYRYNLHTSLKSITYK